MKEEVVLYEMKAEKLWDITVQSRATGVALSHGGFSKDRSRKYFNARGARNLPRIAGRALMQF